MDKFNNPEHYQIIPELHVCSNVAINGGHIIAIGEFPPLIIGKGVIPMVWLYMKINNKVWQPLVTNNISLNSQVLVLEDDENRTTIIKTPGATLLEATMVNTNKCVVRTLDLRPVGLDIFGDSEKLMIGTNRFSNNTFENLQFLIGLDE